MSRNNRILKIFEVLMIEIFRLYLFFGMVIHKLVWEMLKKRMRPTRWQIQNHNRHSSFWLKR